MAYKDKQKAKEYQKKWAKENPEKVKAKRKRFYLKNTEKMKKWHKDWVKKNPKKVKELNSKWIKENPEKIFEYQSQRCFGGNRMKVLDRDNWTCQYCGMTQEQHFLFFERTLYIHHKDENRKNHRLSNLITLCIRCHRIRHNSKIINWKIYQKR